MTDTIIILISFFCAISFDAFADSQQYWYDLNKKSLNMILRHVFQSLMVLSFFLLFIVKQMDLINTLCYLGSYILLRFAVFDVIYNVSIGKKPEYIGENSIYDKILKKVFGDNVFGKSVLMAIRVVALIGGLYLIQRVLPI